jgi:hypothetical protein
MLVNSVRAITSRRMSWERHVVRNRKQQLQSAMNSEWHRLVRLDATRSLSRYPESTYLRPVESRTVQIREEVKK